MHVNFKDFINISKKFTAEPYFVLVIAHQIILHISKIILIIDCKIQGEKLKYLINKEAAKISGLSS